MAKRKAASEPQTTPIDDEIVNITAEPPQANLAAETAPPLGTEGKLPTLGEPRKSSWAPRTVIAVPLTEEAKRDHTKGEVARYIDGYNYDGIGARIDSPDRDFRPSEEVKTALKEEHPYRDSMRWNKKDFHKKVIGKRQDGSERNPIAERLDAEERFEDMVQRRREEIDKANGGKTPF